MDTVESALQRLTRYCVASGYSGWDLYDGLNSRVIQSTPLYRSRLIRLAWIQVFKRLPLNLRRMMGVPQGVNPKGLALFISGHLALGNIGQAKHLLEKLESLRCSGYEGQSWGYNFDWQARAFFVEKGTPNLVTTVFVANSCLDYYSLSGDQGYLSIADDACQFLLRHMILHEDSSELCFRYIPGEDAVVHNACMLGAALLGRVYSHTQEPRYIEASTKAMRRAVNAQLPNGAWPYGERRHHQFVDNFHTGFNLVSLHQWMQDTQNDTWEDEIRRAYDYWLSTFFLPDGCPKYYHDNLYPIDIHCSAQGIITCLKLQTLDRRSTVLASQIAKWAISNLQDKSGYFYYQKWPWYTNRIPYIRWGQAWMFFALALLTSDSRGDKIGLDVRKLNRN